MEYKCLFDNDLLIRAKHDINKFILLLGKGAYPFLYTLWDWGQTRIKLV